MIQAGTSSQTQTMPLVKLSQNNRLRLIDPGAGIGGLAHPCSARRSTSRVQALDTDVPGTVARFAERLDTDTRTMRVEVDVKNPTLELVPGMYATRPSCSTRRPDAVIVPVQAVDRAARRRAS